MVLVPELSVMTGFLPFKYFVYSIVLFWPNAVISVAATAVMRFCRPFTMMRLQAPTIFTSSPLALMVTRLYLLQLMFVLSVSRLTERLGPSVDVSALTTCAGSIGSSVGRAIFSGVGVG